MKNCVTIVLVLLSLCPITHSCEQCVELTWHNCNVCYEDCEDGVKFKSCSQQQCGDTYTDSEGNTQCSYYVTVELSEEDCFYQCCGDDVAQTSEFSIQALNQCKEYNDSSTAILIAVLSTVFGGSCLAGIIFFCREYIKDQCGEQSRECCQNCGECCAGCCGTICFFLLCQCCCDKDDEQRRAENNASGTFMKNKSYQWQRDNSPFFDIQNHTSLCTICLMGKVNTITICGHVYHLRCLIDWYIRNGSCAVCVSGNMNPVKFYCRSCSTGYCQMKIEKTSEQNEMMEKIKGPNCPVCQ